MVRFIVFCCTLGCLLTACSSQYYVRRGNKIYDTGRFYKSAAKYEKAYEKAKPKEYQANAAIRAGQAYEQVNLLKDACAWYRKAQRVQKENPEVYLKIAELYARMEDEEKAKEYYQEYETLFGDGKGNDGLYRLGQISQDRLQEGRYTVALKKELNSRNSDFSPVYFAGDTCTVYFSSTRKSDPLRKKIKRDPITGDGYSHLYKAEYVQEVRTVGKNGEVKVKKFKEPRWLKPELLRDSLYSNRHDGSICFSADGRIAYFTSSRMIKGSNSGTRIYQAAPGSGTDRKDGDKINWSSVCLAGICGDSVSMGHPALTPDGARLYFVADALPGGYGGKDIWYVEKEGEKWGLPVNAGELINTAGDEMFPVVREDGTLYFSSNGRYGFGGLDLYKVETEDGKSRVVHLPAPLNSGADDFGIVFQAGEEHGLFSSGRGGRGDNIFSFRFIPQQLEVKLLAENAATEMPVFKAEVTVTADDGSVTYLETDSSGTTTMPVVADKEYVFVVSHPQYLKGKGTVSTYREKADRLYELSVAMQPIEKPIVIPNIYFDVAKWELRPDARENLEELLQILKDNPNITIELSAHTDMVGNARANLLLSENRAQAVVDYLIEKGVYWDRLEAKGYGKMRPRQINEKEAKQYAFLKAGDVLNERLVGRLRGEQREVALQLNRRIEFKVVRTNYKPGPNSQYNPHRKAVAAEEGVKQIGKTQLKDLKDIKGKFYTLQLGVFKNIPAVIHQFQVVFTEKVKDGSVRYCTGIYDTREQASKAATALKNQGTDCFVREYTH